MQLQYGDDSLDPSMMEGSGRPVDLKRLLINIRNFDVWPFFRKSNQLQWE